MKRPNYSISLLFIENKTEEYYHPSPFKRNCRNIIATLPHSGQTAARARGRAIPLMIMMMMGSCSGPKERKEGDNN